MKNQITKKAIKIDQEDDGHFRPIQPQKPEFSVFNRKQQRKEKKAQQKLKNIERNYHNHQKKQGIKNENDGDPIDQQQQEPKQEKQKQKQEIIKPIKQKVNKRKQELLSQIEQEDQEIQRLTQKLGLKQNRLSNHMIKEDGLDDDLFDFLDHIDQQFKKDKLDDYKPFEQIHKDTKLKQDDIESDDQDNNQQSDVWQDDEDENNEEEDNEVEDNEEEDNEQEDNEDESNENIDEEEYSKQISDSIKEVKNQRDQTKQQQNISQNNNNKLQQKVQENLQQNHKQQANKVEVKPILKSKQEVVSVSIQEPTVNKNENLIDLNSEQAIEIRKALNRNINKVSEANINIIAQEITKIFEENPKQLTMSIFSNILISSTVKAQNLLQYLLSCITAISCYIHQMYDNYCFGELIKQLIKALLSQQDPTERKHMCLVLSHFYLFESISIDFMKEFITFLLEKIDANSLENLTLIIQYCGKKIRADNPAILKFIIEEIKQKVQSQENESRTIYLLSQLNDLKLNKKINSQAEKLDFLVNWLKTKCQKMNLIPKVFPQGFRYCFENKFLNQNWWRPIVSNEEQTKLYQEFGKQKKNQDLQKLEQLAVEQKMITETRKAIFMIVMGSDDLFEATENLIKMGYLKKKKQDVAVVILEVCGNELTYNPYYAALVENLMNMDKSLKSSIQYALWDKFKLISQFSLRKIANLAQFSASLIRKGCLSILIMKWFNFNQLDQQSEKYICLTIKYFLKKIKIEVLAKQCKNLFEKTDYLTLRTGLQYILKNQFRHFLKEDDKQILRDSRIMIKLLDDDLEME